MPSYDDYKTFTRNPTYKVDVFWDYLKLSLEKYNDGFTILDLDPPFQRAHVWIEKQQAAYIEFIIRGGQSGRDIYFNCPNWMNFGARGDKGNTIVCVDGKQRIEAVRKFTANELKIFEGWYACDFDKRMPLHARFIFHINDLKTDAEVLQWYLEFNSGGTPHTQEELNKVRKMLVEAKKQESENS